MLIHSLHTLMLLVSVTGPEEIVKNATLWKHIQPQEDPSAQICIHFQSSHRKLFLFQISSF